MHTAVLVVQLLLMLANRVQDDHSHDHVHTLRIRQLLRSSTQYSSSTTVVVLCIIARLIFMSQLRKQSIYQYIHANRKLPSSRASRRIYATTQETTSAIGRLPLVSSFCCPTPQT